MLQKLLSGMYPCSDEMKHLSSESLFKRAAKVIPGGSYGHTSPVSSLPLHFPKFAEKASGCKYIDVDGNEWIDFMCGYGAIIHGYREPSIESAVDEIRSRGTIFNHPHSVMVELAEMLTSEIDFGNWAVFAKNGSDLTTWSIRVAREFSQKPYIIKACGSYHGVDAWCDPGMGGRISSDRSEILEFKWNDLNQFEDLFKKFSNQIAGVILCPYHHPAFLPSVMPNDEFWGSVRKICDEHEAVLILDDVRAGWRMHSQGSHRYFDFAPDLAVYSKALGNGYAISACVGSERFKKAASDVFLTGSSWNDASAMVAAVQSLSLSKSKNVAESILKKGRFFCEGIEKLAQQSGFDLEMTGPQSMPYPWFKGDDNLYLIQKFCEYASIEGLFFHPHHNWFISDAHDMETLADSLEKTETAFKFLSDSLS
ncbi:MAG: aminotransferase class III [Opitutae bacterium]|nr:aminotransferase class III [Opitutae bacterium]